MKKILKLSICLSRRSLQHTHVQRFKLCLFKAGYIIENFVPTPSRGFSDEERAKYKKIRYEEREDGHIIIHHFPVFKVGKILS